MLVSPLPKSRLKQVARRVEKGGNETLVGQELKNEQ